MINKNVSLWDKLLTAYKQAFLLLVIAFVYSIISAIILGIGIFMAIAGLSNGSTIMFLLGIIIAIIGYILLVVSFFAAFLFSATRGISDTKPLGFVEAYTETFRLILELSIVIIIDIVIFIIGYLIGGGLGGLLIFIGLIIAALYPIASLFYVIEYLKNR